MHQTLQKIRHFLARGPAYYYWYFRWRFLQVWQRTFAFSYKKNRATSDTSQTQLWRTRSTPVFFFETDSIPRIISSIPLDRRRQTLEIADHVCRREFSFRQSEFISLGSDLDWTFAPEGNKDWCWDLNRHAYFETLGFAYHYSKDEKYARAFVEILNDWLSKNPASIQAANWSSAFEVGYRINSWTWAYFLLRESPTVSDANLLRLVNGIHIHCQFLHTNLEYHARNNHLLLEAKALLFAAILFPEFPESRRWKSQMEKILYREIREQVHDDGVHGELSTHYHRVIAGELLELLVLGRINGKELPPDIQSRIEKMVEFEISIKRPDGTLALFGDSSQQDNYARFSASAAGPSVFTANEAGHDSNELDEASTWRLAEYSADKSRPALSTENLSKAFRSGGYYIMRSGNDVHDAMYMCIDCGPFGLHSDPHHGHADALSFELFALGRPWFIDSGVFSTHTSWDWRQYFRGTRSHNTIIVDNEDQSLLLDSRRILSAATASNQRWITSKTLDYFEGSHDGYQRLSSPVTHTRSIWFVRGEYWLIVDKLTGSGNHTIESNFHFPDDVAVSIDKRNAILTADGRGLAIICDSTIELSATLINGEIDPIQGWRSYNSGQKTAAPTLSYCSSTPLPVVICLAIVPLAKSDTPQPTVQIESTTDGSLATVKFNDRTDYLFNASGSDAGEHSFADYRTSGSVVFVREFADAQRPARYFSDCGQVHDGNGVEIQEQF